MNMLSKFASLFVCIAIHSGTSAAATRHVSADELYAAAKSTAEDGRLTREELRRWPKLAAIVSVELAKGHVTRAEVAAVYRAHRAANENAFDTIDANRDGKLSRDEVALLAPSLAAAFAVLDQGAKGYLTLKDFFSPRIVLKFAPTKSKVKLSVSEIAQQSALTEANRGATLDRERGMELLGGDEATGNAADWLPEGVVTWQKFVQGAPDFRDSHSNTRIKLGCDPGVPCVDEIIVIGSSVGDVLYGVGSGGGGENVILFDAIVVSDISGMTEEDFIKIFKKTAGLCKKSTESCSDWGVRIGLNYCTRAGTLVSICNLAIHTEVNTNNCSNVSCP